MSVMREEVKEWVAKCYLANGSPFLQHLLAALDDAERIEWLEARQWIDMQRDIDGVWLEADDVRPERWIPSVREAIDTARAGGEG